MIEWRRVLGVSVAALTVLSLLLLQKYSSILGIHTSASSYLANARRDDAEPFRNVNRATTPLKTCVAVSPAKVDGLSKLCGPTYFVLGLAKCGTTSFYCYMRQHPDVYVHRSQEMHLFEQSWSAQKNFASAQKVYSRILNGFTFPPNGVHTNTVFGMHSPSVLWNVPKTRDAKCTPSSCRLKYHTNHTLVNVAKLMPRTQVYAAVVRDPVARAWSHFRHFSSRCPGENLSAPACFDKMVRGQINWLEECFEANGRGSSYCAKAPFHKESKSKRIVSMGLYMNMISEAMQVLPDGIKMCVVSHAVFSSDLNTEMKTFESCAGMRPFGNYTSLTLEHGQQVPVKGGHRPDECNTLHKNTEKYRSKRDPVKVSMLDSTRDLLQRFYAPFNRQLASFSGRSLKELGMDYSYNKK